MKTDWSSQEMVEGIGSTNPRPHYFYLRFALEPHNTVLEVGSGPCQLYRYLVSKGVRAKYSACDLTTEMLSKARERVPGIDLFECDVQDMSRVPDNSYDWVVCSDVLIHVPRPFEGLEHLWRCTGGALLLVIRESTFPEDVVDNQRAYQLLDGVRYYYNVLNLDRTAARLRELMPHPQAIEVHRQAITEGHDVTHRHFPFDPAKHTLWATSYVLSKDRSRAKWLPEGDINSWRPPLPERLVIKGRRLLGLPAYSNKGP